MRFVDIINELGIILMLQPIDDSINFSMLNLIDDIGIFFVCKPLWYIQRLAEIILGVEASDRTVIGQPASCVSSRKINYR